MYHTGMDIIDLIFNVCAVMAIIALTFMLTSFCVLVVYGLFQIMRDSNDGN